MLYLHDIWVNWFEGEENGYNVCYFHEWRKMDQIELVDQIPLLYITDEMYFYIENDLQELPETMLQYIHKQAFIRKGSARKPLAYAAVVTNGIDILAFDTIGYESPIRKSRLIPRQEKIVFELLKKRRKKSFKIPVKRYKKVYHILSMHPQYMYGLTRKERQLKQLLMMALDQLMAEENVEALKYWLTEWNPKKYASIKYMNLTDVQSELYEGLKRGWSETHEKIGTKLIKSHPVLEKMWQLEVSEHQDPSRLK